MNPQNPPQLQISRAQIEQNIKQFEAKIKAKTLECVSLGQLRDASADVIARLYGYREKEFQKPVQDAVYNYLTAKLNEQLINLEALQLQLNAWKAMTNMVQPAVVG